MVVVFWKFIMKRKIESSNLTRSEPIRDCSEKHHPNERLTSEEITEKMENTIIILLSDPRRRRSESAVKAL